MDLETAGRTRALRGGACRMDVVIRDLDSRENRVSRPCRFPVGIDKTGSCVHIGRKRRRLRFPALPCCRPAFCLKFEFLCCGHCIAPPDIAQKLEQSNPKSTKTPSRTALRILRMSYLLYCAPITASSTERKNALRARPQGALELVM